MSQSDTAALQPAGRQWPWRPGLLLVLILAVFYGALQNGQWVPISDADLYLAIARNIALGQGFTFNGLPVRATPPGWPYFLAGLMRVNAGFLLLNLVQMAMGLAWILLFYRILLRLTSPRRAFIVCLVAGILSPVYHGTFLLNSEPLFCLLAAGAVLLALQANEGRPAAWRLGLVVLLAVGTVAVRWAGLLLCPLIVGALLRGRLWPSRNRLWLCATLTVLLVCGAFFGLRYALNQQVKTTPLTPDERTYAANSHPIGRTLSGWPQRLPTAGTWFCNLLAEPMVIGDSFYQVKLLAAALGWLLVAFFVAGMLPHALRKDWLMPGAFVYALAFFVIWSDRLPRYMVPVAPLLLLGIWDGIERVGRVGAAPLWGRLRALLLYGVLGCTLACNLSLWAVDAWIIHSPDFYGRYLAGQTEPLIAIADYLKAQDVQDGQVVRCHVPLGKVGTSPTVGRLLDIRGLSLLIGRTILMPPRDTVDAPDSQMAAWMKAHGALYFVRRYPINPWRIWHFRVPAIQRLVTGRPVGPPTPYFTLYELEGGRLEQVQVPPWHGRIDRVPGL